MSSPAMPPQADLTYFCRALMETSLNPMASVQGADHVVFYVNPAFCHLAGKSKDQLIGSIFPCMPAGDECALMLDRVYRTGRAETHTGHEGATQHPLYWSYSMSQIRGQEDSPLGTLIQVTESTPVHGDAIAMNQALLLGSLRQHELAIAAEKLSAQLHEEISVSKQAQETLAANELSIQAALKEKNILLGEIHHRVKNNLQVIYSLLDLQASQTEDPALVAMLRDSQHRIRSMALIHQTLYQSKDFAEVDFGMFLNSLVPILVQSYIDNPERIILSINAKDIRLPINAAIPCGLLVNEVVSNCLKHAFPNGRRGKIDIDFEHEENESVMLSVSDNGVGIPESLDMARTVSLGLQLTFLLADQLHGTMTVHRSNPTSFVLRFQTKDLSVSPE